MSHKKLVLLPLLFMMSGCGLFDPAVKIDHSFDPPYINMMAYSRPDSNSPISNSIEVFQNENFTLEIHFARLKELTITEIKISDEMYYLKDNDYKILPESNDNNFIQFDLCYTNPGEFTHKIQAMTYTNGEKTKSVELEDQPYYEAHYTIKKILDVPSVDTFICTPGYNSLDIDVTFNDIDNALEVNHGTLYLYEEDKKDPIDSEYINKAQEHIHFEQLHNNTKFQIKIEYRKITGTHQTHEDILFYTSEYYTTKNGLIISEVTRGSNTLKFKIDNKLNAFFAAYYSIDHATGESTKYNYRYDKDTSTFLFFDLKPETLYNFYIYYEYIDWDFQNGDALDFEAKTLAEGSPSIELFNEKMTANGLDIDIRISDTDNRLQDFKVVWLEDNKTVFSKLYKDDIYQKFHFDMKENKTYELKIIVFYKDGNNESKNSYLSINYPSDLPLGLL